MATRSIAENPVSRLNAKEYSTTGLSLTQLALRRLRRDKLTMLALIILAALALLAAGAPVISEYILNVDPNDTDAAASRFLPIGAEGHILGTDNIGRDHLARLLFAGQISLGIGVSSAFLSFFIGITLGVITGYYGGGIDDLINWLITTVTAIPGLVLLLLIAALFSPGPWTLILVLAFLTWTATTRLVRGETFSIRERDYILSARAIGAKDFQIMFRHILPNLFSVTIVTLAINIGNVILIESALSFLGLGVQPPTPTWGNMLSNSRTFFKQGPHLVVFPGLLIMLTVLCLYIIGDGLRDAFDPKTVD
ncbi:MAG: ABC transporter permease [Anaerolineae bacterium]|nr:ABC transporter permease [Anaerolineae bacterium]